MKELNLKLQAEHDDPFPRKSRITNLEGQYIININIHD